MENIDDVPLENLEDPREACREGLRQCEIDWKGRFRKERGVIAYGKVDSRECMSSSLFRYSMMRND